MTTTHKPSDGTLNAYKFRVEHGMMLLREHMPLDDEGEELHEEGKSLLRDVALMRHGSSPDECLAARVDAFCVAAEALRDDPPTRYCPVERVPG